MGSMVLPTQAYSLKIGGHLFGRQVKCRQGDIAAPELIESLGLDEFRLRQQFRFRKFLQQGADLF